jgi:hypothetical protein
MFRFLNHYHAINHEKLVITASVHGQSRGRTDTRDHNEVQRHITYLQLQYVNDDNKINRQYVNIQ